MRRFVIGGRSRVLQTRDSQFASGAELISNFDAHRPDIEAADVVIWSWYALDIDGRPDREATLRGTDIILNELVGVGSPLVFLSTDGVFSGAGGPYGEGDVPEPQTSYGIIKLAQEQVFADHAPILRFTTFWPSYNLYRPLLIEMVARGEIHVRRPRQYFSPISTVSLNRVIDTLGDSGLKGSIYHLTSEPISKADCVEKIEHLLGVSSRCEVEHDASPSNLSLTSVTHRFSLADELNLAIRQWKEESAK